MRYRLKRLKESEAEGRAGVNIIRKSKASTSFWVLVAMI
jgi:hypothetical protein